MVHIEVAFVRRLIFEGARVADGIFNPGISFGRGAAKSCKNGEEAKDTLIPPATQANLEGTRVTGSVHCPISLWDCVRRKP